ncbi:integrase core domain protein [Plakobranchus ocellatus]|uniref:Integrase core domain protein n=1 Tax=Plakobranchus ocellatus TaxID=259542 RepID=A0AAV4D0F1_9GAST|nr:integrase core domain protein [Plakobranchus ocellatus]
MQLTVFSAEDMQENVIHDGGNKTGGEAMVIKQPSISALTERFSASNTCCIHLKETSGAHTCQKCTKIIHVICGHSTLDDGDNDVEGSGASV